MTLTPAHDGGEANNYSLLTLSAKNASLPIFRLPSETLAEIFIHGARDHHKTSRSSIDRVPDWVNVSYVCRRWRDVALNCPALWTYHFITSLRWTEELLARSKLASLRICIHFSGGRRPISWWSALVEKILNHAERIQELRLNLPAPIISTVLSLYGPRLQILDIFATHRPTEWSLATHTWDIPSLCVLRLTECPLLWYSFNLSRLTILYLCRIPLQSRQTTMAEFLTTLRHMQALTESYLEHCLPESRGFVCSGAFEVFPRVRLPSLAHLFVLDRLSAVVALLSSLSIPLEAELNLHFEREPDSSVDDYARIAPALARRFHQPEDLPSFSPTIHSLVISSFISSLSNEASFSFSDSYRATVHPLESCNIPLAILVEVEQSMVTSDRDRIITDICCAIPLTDVQTLHVKDPPLESEFWAEILGHLPGLRHLKLSEGFMPELDCLLDLSPDDDEPEDIPGGGPDDDHDTIYVPELEELELYHIIFESEEDYPEDAVSLDALRDALSTRTAPHPRLTVTECDTAPDNGYPFSFLAAYNGWL